MSASTIVRELASPADHAPYADGSVIYDLADDLTSTELATVVAHLHVRYPESVCILSDNSNGEPNGIVMSVSPAGPDVASLYELIDEHGQCVIVPTSPLHDMQLVQVIEDAFTRRPEFDSYIYAWDDANDREVFLLASSSQDDDDEDDQMHDLAA